MLLMSFWKPLLILLLFVPWAWIVSKIYDKHAARFHLPRRQWNLFHMLMGVAAICVALFAGITLENEGAFWIGVGGMLLIFAIDLVAYAVVANRDERVPEDYHIHLDIASKLAERKADKASAKLEATVSLNIKQPKGGMLAPPMKETPEFEIRAAAEEQYRKAVGERATRIDYGPAGKDSLYGLSIMVDGVRRGEKTFPAQDAVRLMDFWKSAAQLDLSDRRRKQSAEISIEQDGRARPVRISTQGSNAGVRLTILLDPSESVLRKPNELGLLEPQLEAMRAITEDEGGVVLHASAPGQGRTTTMYTIVQMHDAYTQNVQTLEIDPLASIEGVRKNVFDPTVGAEYSTTLRSILRRDPDVVAVADLPDARTAIEAVSGDIERTRVYVSLKGDNALAVVQTFVKAVGDPKRAADALHGVIAQKLIRKLCTNCRVGYAPSADMLKKLGLPEGKVAQLYKKGGQVLIKNKPDVCPVCQGSGYFGQSGLFEVFPIGPEERECIAAGNYAGLKALFRKRQLPTMQQVALKRAIDGTTSVEEIMRVNAPAKKPGQPVA